MKVLPSTSWMREPEARRMKRGDPPTALKARTGLSTPPGNICRAREKSLRDCEVRTLREGFGRINRVVRDDDVGAGAPDCGQRFHHRARLVDPAVARRRFQHRVLSADVVR